MKIATLRLHYFKKPWNVFDFIIVISSLVGMWHGFRLYESHPIIKIKMYTLPMHADELNTTRLKSKAIYCKVNLRY